MNVTLKNFMGRINKTMYEHIILATIFIVLLVITVIGHRLVIKISKELKKAKRREMKDYSEFTSTKSSYVSSLFGSFGASFDDSISKSSEVRPFLIRVKMFGSLHC